MRTYFEIHQAGKFVTDVLAVYVITDKDGINSTGIRMRQQGRKTIFWDEKKGTTIQMPRKRYALFRNRDNAEIINDLICAGALRDY